MSGVNDTAIVDRGRNVVSVSSDGTARLWDCGSQTCLSVVSAGCGIIGGCAVGAPLPGCLPPAQPAGVISFTVSCLVEGFHVIEMPKFA